MQFLEYFKGMEATQWIGLAVVLLALGWAMRDKLKGLFSGAVATVTEGDDEREEAFHAASKLLDYFTAVGCEEGKSAARECGRHLFSDHPHTESHG